MARGCISIGLRRQASHTHEVLEDDISLDSFGRDGKVWSQIASDPESTSRARKFCKALGLDVVYLLYEEIRKHQSVEQPKVLILRDLRTACYLSLIHVIPLLASGVLLFLNWRGLYIGKELQGTVGEDDLKILGLQFVAKLIELLSVASLTTIMLDILRTYVINDSLPFGALTAAYEFNKLSMLWSQGFIAACVSPFKSGRRKAFLVVTIIIFTILSTIIGPSAAVVALPALQTWPAGGTNFWLNETSNSLWPQILEEASEYNFLCNTSNSATCAPNDAVNIAKILLAMWPSGKSHGLDHGKVASVVPEKVHIAARQSFQTMEVRFRGPFLYSPQLTVATTSLAAISDAATQLEKYWFSANARSCAAGKSRFCWYKDFACSINAYQPVTYASCAAGEVDDAVKFPNLEQDTDPFFLVDYRKDDVGSRRWFAMSTSNSSHPGLDFVDLPRDQFGAASIGAIAAIPGSKSSDASDQILACTIDARWALANVTVSFLGGPALSSGTPDKWALGGRTAKGSNGQALWPQIKLAPAWAHSVNAKSSNTSMTAFETLANSVGRLNSISDAEHSLNAVEAVLTVLITQGLAKTASQASIQGSLRGLDKGEWIDELLPRDTVYGKDGKAFDYTPGPNDSSTELKMKTSVTGYGYGITTARLLSTLTLSMYCLIAIAYIIHTTCCSQVTSNAWNSMIELLALAVNSNPLPAMQNTGAGIDTLGVLKRRVRVGSDDGNLRIVTENETELRKVQKNETYG